MLFHLNHRSCFGLIAGLLSLAPCFRQASADELQQLWDFSEPALRAPELDPNGLKINILYNVSDYINSNMVAYSVTDFDCEANVEEWFVPYLISPTVDYIRGDGTGYGVIEMEIVVDPDSFADATGFADASENDASFWQQDNQDRYQIMFCLYVGVQTEEDPPTVVDKSETQIMVTYDLTDGFAIEFEVTPVKRDQNATDGYGVDG
jgi:hypothetical protein